MLETRTNRRFFNNIAFFEKVIEDSITWLNDWEDRINNKNSTLTNEDFLTQKTANGLRMTLNSAKDLTYYLIKKYKFSSVLTGKMNQDALEVNHFKNKRLF